MPINPKHAVDAQKAEKIEVADEIFIPEEPKWSLDEIILPDDVKNQILDVAT